MVLTQSLEAARALPRRRLGRTHMHVSVLGLGGVGMGGLYGPADEGDSIATVWRALDLGMNYVDTSPLYLESERRFGVALRDVPRDRYYLSTKMGTHPSRRGDYSAETTRWSIENSLKLLGTRYVDLLMVHDPPDIEAPLAPGAAFDVLHEYKQEGVCGAVGMGQRNHDFHRRAIDAGRVDAILTFADYNLVRQTAAPLIDYAASAGVGVILAQAVLAGLLAGPDPAGDERLRKHPDYAAARGWWEWAREREVSLPAVALQFALRNPNVSCVLVGAKTPKEVEENLAAVSAPLPDGIWSEVEVMIAAP